jgi:hypothetical protein
MGNEQNSDERTKIGKEIIYFALIVIGVLGLASVVVAGFLPSNEIKDRTALVKDVLTSLLPVLGTWVGTVLAFYFSKDNFIAAAQQTSNLVHQLTSDEKLQTIPVIDIMILMTDENTTKIVLDKQEDAINLTTELLEKYKTSGRNRLPLIDIDGKPKYVIHRSIIDQFISAKALVAGTDLKAFTLKDFFAEPEYKEKSIAFGTVNKEAKLNAVKALIDGSPNCSDVFVTEDGSKNSKALGWITNVILAEKSKV